MVNKPLIRLYFWGGVALGGAARIPLISNLCKGKESLDGFSDFPGSPNAKMASTFFLTGHGLVSEFHPFFKVKIYYHPKGTTISFLTWPMAKRLKLFGITYLVGKIKFKLVFFKVHWLSEF